MISSKINRLLNIFGIQLKKVKALEIERDYYGKIINGAIDIFEVHKKYEGRSLNLELSGLVFSKDRAMQLHALLRSYIYQVGDFSPLSILYTTTNQNSRQSYEDLKAEFKGFPFQFIEEDLFYDQVKSWLATQSADRVFFMTDDAIFLDVFNMQDALLFNPLNEVFSLTKGKDLRYCFTMDINQELPKFTPVIHAGLKSFNTWRWADCPASPDWTYPLSLDGTFYLRAELICLVDNISFKNPNSLEASMQVFKSFFLSRNGVCYDKVKMINIPCNLVQHEFINRSTGFFDVSTLQLFWDEGKRINVEMFYGLNAFDAEHAKYTFLKKQA